MIAQDTFSVGRALARYQTWLVIFLSATWLLHLSKAAKASSVGFFGMKISDKLLLGLVPGISTILLLGLLGAVITMARSRSGSGEGAAGWTDFVSTLWPSLPAGLVHGLLLLTVIASTIAVGLTLAPKFKGYSVFLFTSYCLLCAVLQGFAGWQWFSRK